MNAEGVIVGYYLGGKKATTVSGFTMSGTTTTTTIAIKGTTSTTV